MVILQSKKTHFELLYYVYYIKTNEGADVIYNGLMIRVDANSKLAVKLAERTFDLICV